MNNETDLEQKYTIIKIDKNSSLDLRKIKKKIIQITFFFSILSLLIGILTYWLVNNNLTALKTYKRVNAKVISHKTQSSPDSKGKSSITYAPVVEYHFQEKNYQSVSNFSCSGGCYDKGEVVEALINPHRPNDFEINSFLDMWMMPISIGVIFTMLSSISIFLIRRILKLKGKFPMGFSDRRQFLVTSVEQFTNEKALITVTASFEDIQFKYIISRTVYEYQAKHYIAGVTILTGYLHRKNKKLVEIDWDSYPGSHHAAA